MMCSSAVRPLLNVLVTTTCMKTLVPAMTDANNCRSLVQRSPYRTSPPAPCHPLRRAVVAPNRLAAPVPPFFSMCSSASSASGSDAPRTAFFNLKIRFMAPAPQVSPGCVRSWCPQ